jgi:hypothetical protein
MKHTILFFLLAVIALSSCQEVVQLDVEEGQRRLVVNGGIQRRNNADSLRQRISLTTTYGFYEESFPPPTVTDARVVVFDGTDSIPFEHTGFGFYEATYSPQPGAYTLVIDYNNERYTAIDTMTPAPTFDSVRYEFQEKTIFDDEGYTLQLYFQDNPDYIEYYRFVQFINDSLSLEINPGTRFETLTDGELIDGEYVSGRKPNDIPGQVGDTMRIEMYSISRIFYDYTFAILRLAGGAGSLNEPPPAGVRGNVGNTTNEDNYALGFFEATDVVIEEVIIEEK